MKYIKDRPLRWVVSDLEEKDFTCGYCQNHTSSDKGMLLVETVSEEYEQDGAVYICSHCKMPTFTWQDVQVPGVKMGGSITEVSDELKALYEEARSAYAAGAYTGVVLLCEKVLKYACVELGAEPDLPFIDYLTFLDENHYVTSKVQEWVNRVKSDTEKAHEIVIKSKQQARELIRFCEMMIKVNFEYPNYLHQDSETE